MLTRLKVTGFKNLVDADVSFGPFTCIAGANAVGKSNLFDAITFLSALADQPLLSAALSVRSAEHGRGGDVRPIFRHAGDTWGDEMRFDAEMLVPRAGVDDLGQEAKASITFLRYTLVIGRRATAGTSALEIRHEELGHIKLDSARRHLPFRHSAEWRKSVAKGRRTSKFISTDPVSGRIMLHLDVGTGGRPRPHQALTLPRTVLSSATAAESPTALVARREMQSWRLLQLEPSAMRNADEFTFPSRMSRQGAHLPATLTRLAANGPRGRQADAEGVYARVANRVAELVEGIRGLRVDRDEKRQLLSLLVKDRSGTEHEARALSDGTLRFLALAVLEADPETAGLLCLEEPENGIHPGRMGAMLALLQDLAVDPMNKVGEDNPLRQVIINTHSPAVVSLVPDDSLVLASLEPDPDPGRPHAQIAAFRWLSDTWRARAFPERSCLSRGELLSYLDPTGAVARREESPPASRRVASRPDLQPFLPGIAVPTVHE